MMTGQPHQSSSECSVYLTGAGIVSAIGCGVEQVEQALRQRRSGVGRVHHLPTAHVELPCGEVELTDDELCQRLHIDPGQPYNRTALMGIEAIGQALAQSGIAPAEAFLVAGTTVGGMDRTERHFLEMLEQGSHLDLLASHDSGSTIGLMAAHFSIPDERVVALSTACSSAANAVIVGANMIKTGETDCVIVGGSEALSLFHLNGFHSLMILDTERCRPFDERRKGLNLGEGAAFVVLESSASVARRGATPLAVLAGYGNRCDAFHQTASSVDGEGAYQAMTAALAMSGLSARDIGYVNAHGTGTPNNDASESAALKRVFGDALPPVSSTKPFTGHTTSAAGCIELVISMLALRGGFIPANLGWQYPMSDGIVPTLGQEGVSLRHVMCNSFGFGGNDASLILSAVGQEREAIEQWHVETVNMVTRAVVRSTPEAPLDNLKEFLSPMESRRLCKLLKTALMTSLTALRQAGVDCPDAIIVGTSYGMLENSEKFLFQLCRQGEQGLSPTLFMQSTHNTIAGTLAARMHCHGYNVTYTRLGEQPALDLCLNDARRLMRLGQARTVLVGWHNEVTPALGDMLRRWRGEELQQGVTSVAMVVEKM